MIYTPRIKKALQFAARKHANHFRAELPPLPYITHLVSALLIAAEHTNDEDVLVSILLHDTVEDTATTFEEIEADFGLLVRSMVQTVSDPKGTNETPLSWKEKKEIYLEQLRQGGDQALMVAAADKIDNLESKLEAFAREGESFFSRFKERQSSYIWYHGEVLKIVEASGLPQGLKDRFQRAHALEKEKLATL